MTKKDRERFRKILLELRKQMTGQIDTIKETELTTTVKDASGDHSSYSFHMADQGTDNMEREKNFFYAQRNNHTLQDIEDALDRIENETYGLCVQCEKPISRERLEIVPYTLLCISCQSDQEKLSRINPFATGE
jgi:DnaK suppressor protein